MFGKRISGVSTEALAALTDYDWPGNVRELQNIIERAAVVAQIKELSEEEAEALLLQKLGSIEAQRVQ